VANPIPLQNDRCHTVGCDAVRKEETRSERKRNSCIVWKGDENERVRESEMNEELEVRETSLSYVIGRMNNDSTRKAGDNDPCRQGMV
jgi:hypothetical protein